MESADNKDGMKNADSKFNQEIYSKVVRAGKRTYFFDVKSTRSDEYYLTITESKKRFGENGKFHYEKHKIFLYKEDFEKFAESLQDIVDYIHENQPEIDATATTDDDEPGEEKVANFTNVDFEDI
jgi:hypothetical protein